MNIWQLLKEQNLLLSPCIQQKNFNYLIPLYPSMVTGSPLLRILILKLWLPGGQERLMARQFSIKCMSILKIIQEMDWKKTGKMKIWWIEGKKSGENSGTKLCCMEDQHHQQPLAKKARRKINTSTLSAKVIASDSLASMSSDMVINIEQIPPILHPEKPSADNFSYFSGHNAKSKFLQWEAPLESSNSTSWKRRCMVCFDSGREDRMYTYAGRGGRAKCQFS